MKKLLLIFAIAFVGTGLAVAQEADETATSQGKSALVSSKTSGLFQFNLPSSVEKEQVEKAAKYYTHYFSVDFNEATHEVVIDLVEDDKNSYIIGRFLTACGVRYVTVDAENVDIQTFIKEYLSR